MFKLEARYNLSHDKDKNLQKGVKITFFELIVNK